MNSVFNVGSWESAIRKCAPGVAAHSSWHASRNARGARNVVVYLETSPGERGVVLYSKVYWRTTTRDQDIDT